MNWIIITLCAAALQTLRNGLSKRLKTDYSPAVVSLSRFVFGLPVMVLLGLLLYLFKGVTMTINSPLYWVWICCGGAAQIAGNALLIHSFKRHMFSLSIAFIRVEVLSAAIGGWMLLGTPLKPVLWPAFGLIAAGIFIAKRSSGLKSVKGSKDLRKKAQKSPALLKTVQSVRLRSMVPTVLATVGGGLFFGLAAVFVKSAYRYGYSETGFSTAAYSLLFMLIIQTVAGLLFLAFFHNRELKRMLVHPGRPMMVGLSSAAGSLCWFTAFSMADAGAVKVVGQSEMLFAALTGIILFKEVPKRRDWTGLLLILTGILLFTLL